jgi:hypothetical protein
VQLELSGSCNCTISRGRAVVDVAMVQQYQYTCCVCGEPMAVIAAVKAAAQVLHCSRRKWEEDCVLL